MKHIEIMALVDEFITQRDDIEEKEITIQNKLFSTIADSLNELDCIKQIQEKLTLGKNIIYAYIEYDGEYNGNGYYYLDHQGLCYDEDKDYEQLFNEYKTEKLQSKIDKHIESYKNIIGKLYKYYTDDPTIREMRIYKDSIKFIK